MIIEIKKDCVKITQKFGERQSSKIVNFDEFISKLSMYQKSSFGLLPRDTRILESNGEMTVVGIEFPAKQRKINFNSVKYSDDSLHLDVFLPSGIYFEVLRRADDGKYLHNNSYIFATRGNRVTFGTDQLYYYPMPNIYTDGRICWGNIKTKPFQYLSAVEGMVSSFFEGAFNSDLFRTDSVNIKVNDASSYFVKLNEAGKFDDNWLVPHGYTMGDVAHKLLRKL